MRQASGCAGGIANGLALLLAALLTIALPLSLAAHDLGLVLFSPERLNDLIVSHLVEGGQLRRLLVVSLIGGDTPGQAAVEGFDMAAAASHLTPAQLDAVGEALFPPGWIEDHVAAFLDRLYAWPDNDELAPALSLDLRPVVAWLRSGGAHDLVETLVDSWPPCSPHQVERMTAEAATTGMVSLQYCEPPEPYRSALTSYATAALLARAEAMPPQVFLSGVSAGTDAEEVAALKRKVRLMRLLLTHGWLIPLFLLGLITALVVRSYRSLTLWWGIPLLGGGLLGFVLLLVGGAVMEQAIARMADGQASQVLARAVAGMGGALVREVQGRLLWQSALVVLASIGLMASRLVLGRRTRDLGAVPPSALGS